MTSRDLHFGAQRIAQAAAGHGIQPWQLPPAIWGAHPADGSSKQTLGGNCSELQGVTIVHAVVASGCKWYGPIKDSHVFFFPPPPMVSRIGDSTETTRISILITFSGAWPGFE